MLQINFDDLIGKPFKSGGRGPDAFDCWGLVLELLKRQGHTDIPDFQISAFDFNAIGARMDYERLKWRQLEKPEPGAVMLIRFNCVAWCNHCGLYLGNGQFIHAREKAGVCIDRTESPAWARKIEGYYLPPA